MGAIQRNGYEFQTEFSQISKTVAIHVYKNGKFIKEMTLPFKGEQPDGDLIEEKIEEFFS